MDEPAVPVLMYHSVGIPNKNWQWNYLTIHYKIFENQLHWMNKKGYHSISLQQLYEYMKEGSKLPKNPIVLTFDDGYLDNWVFAYPLLKKYNFKATVYVNPEFVDPRDILRKNLENFWKREINIEQLETTGYLSWTEMKEMEKEGYIDIQSHTMSHTWYPIGNKIIDFRHPGDSYIWMTWNEKPAKKYLLQFDNKESITYGLPIYEYGRAIAIKRYFPDKRIDEFLVDYVKKKDVQTFFESDNWRGELFKLIQQFLQGNIPNESTETKEEYEQRIFYELKKSKEIIQEKLNKTIKFLCWPGGAVTADALKIALDVGYISSNIGKDKNSERTFLKNRYGEDPSRINRIVPILYWDRREEIGSKINYMNGFFLTLLLIIFQNKKSIHLLPSLVLNGIARIYKIRM
jgi:peptidoglycan/xylan/chitin deacetylase (PgdA/CDA1 family)